MKLGGTHSQLRPQRYVAPVTQNKKCFWNFLSQLTEKKKYDIIIIYRKELFVLHYVGTTDTDEYFEQGTVAEPGDVVYYTVENKFYEYYDNGPGKSFGWRPLEPEKLSKDSLVSLGLTEYELNKIAVAQLPALITEAQLRKGKELIKEFTHRHITSVGYYMLLGRDINYYTVFEVCDEYEEKVEDVVIECLQNIGVIQCIDPSENNHSIECWVKNDKGTFVLYLFDYSEGVITCQ